ncbi:hypothetical protein [Paludibacterium yongneupense]|nr:hypothetical protein [Paludibacterium yongneupense]
MHKDWKVIFKRNCGKRVVIISQNKLHGQLCVQSTVPDNMILNEPDDSPEFVGSQHYRAGEKYAIEIEENGELEGALTDMDFSVEDVQEITKAFVVGNASDLA